MFPTRILRLSAALGLLLALAACDRSKDVMAKTPHYASEPPIDAVALDGGSVEDLVLWARTESLDVPTSWRSQPAYMLAREWARGTAQPDPYVEVERILTAVRDDKTRTPPELRLNRIESLRRQIALRYHEFLPRALSIVQSYLPERCEVRARVFLAAFLPVYAFAWGDGIVINLSASIWGGDPNVVLNQIVHELHHRGFAACGHDPPTPPLRREDLLEDVLWQIQNEGMATYVGWIARSADIKVEDYLLLEDDSAVTARFMKINQMLDAIGGTSDADLPGLREQIWRLGVDERSFYVVGAWMARRIEQQHGRSRLVTTVRDGPRAFMSEYHSTVPVPELRVTSLFERDEAGKNTGEP